MAAFITNRIARINLALALPLVLSVLVLADFGLAAPQRSSKKTTPRKVTTEAKSKTKVAADTTPTVKKEPVAPLPPLPPFSQLDQWEQRSSRGSVSEAPVGHIARSIERLCRYFGIGYDITSPLVVSLSPHEWPLVFADQKPNARRQRIEIENMLTRNSLRFDPLITPEPKDLADVLARAVAGGEPVLINAPAAPIIYGFDRREADAWWLVQWREQREIVYESERVKMLVWWTDDPSANIAWAIRGLDSNAATSKFQQNDYGWLQTLTASVAGNERQGVSPYPLSIRGFRDKLAADAAMPELLVPVDTLDPLGIRRARSTREYTVGVVERLNAMAVDTALSQPLRLALYFYHNATQSLDRLDSLLYDASPAPNVVARARTNWADPGRKSQAVEALTQLLEWEKQAAQQVATALAVHDKKKQ